MQPNLQLFLNRRVFIVKRHALLIVVIAFGIALTSVYSAQAQNISANDACKAGNYNYDYRTKKEPCNVPAGKEGEGKKCRLNFPCYEFTNGVKTAIGVCVAENECKGTMVKVCDESACRWEPPQRPRLPSAPEAHEIPTPPSIDIEKFPNVGTLPPEYRIPYGNEEKKTEESLLASWYRNIIVDPITPEVQERKYLDISDRADLSDDLLRSERFTLGGDVPKIPRVDIETETKEMGFPLESRTRGSTFAEVKTINEPEGPPISVQRFTSEEIEQQRLIRELPTFLDNWTRIGRQEIAETVRNWLATEIPSAWTSPTISEEHLEPPTRMVVREYDSIGAVVVDAVRALFGFEPLAPARPVDEIGTPRTSSNISPQELAALDRDAATTLALGYYGPNEPDLYGRFMYSKIHDPGHLDLITFDNKGRAILIAEPGDGPVWRVNTPNGLELVEQLYGCTDECLRVAYKEAEDVEREAAEKADYEKCAEVPCDAEYVEEPPKAPPSETKNPPSAEKVPAPEKVPRPTTKTQKPVIKPAPTERKSSPTPRVVTPTRPVDNAKGYMGNESISSAMSSLLSSLIQLISNLLNWWSANRTPQPPTLAPTPAPLTIYAQLTVNPPAIEKGKTSRLFWSSTNTDSCAIYRPNGRVFLNGGPRGNASTSPLYATTIFRLVCTSGFQSAESSGVVIVR